MLVICGVFFYVKKCFLVLVPGPHRRVCHRGRCRGQSSHEALPERSVLYEPFFVFKHRCFNSLLKVKTVLQIANCDFQIATFARWCVTQCHVYIIFSLLNVTPCSIDSCSSPNFERITSPSSEINPKNISKIENCKQNFSPIFQNNLHLPFSVTRFGKILPLQQHFKVFGFCLRICLALGKIFNILWLIVYAIWQIFIVVNDQKLNK